MRNDERERLDRRVNDQWARRMRALEREFERADRARRPRSERTSVPMAVLSGVVVILVAVLILVLTSGGTSSRPAAAPAPLGPFGSTPAAHWHDAAAAIVLPTAAPAGVFSAADVHAALAAARTRLVAARATGAALAPGNSLLAPVRATGTLTYRYVPAAGRTPEHLLISGNVVWAYALRARYAEAAGPGQVIAVHERVELSALPAAKHGVALQRRPDRDETLWFDADCAYRAAGRVGLPRANDPDALPGYGNGVSIDQAFNPATTVEVTGHICR